MASTTKTGGGNRKTGRNKKWCEAYRLRGMREKNKNLKILRHLKTYPGDNQAHNALRSINDKRKFSEGGG